MLKYETHDRVRHIAMVDHGQPVPLREYLGVRLGGRLNGSPVDDLPGRRLLGVAERTKYLFGKESLSALYPAGTDEKRWGDGVLARKKGLGL